MSKPTGTCPATGCSNDVVGSWLGKIGITRFAPHYSSSRPLRMGWCSLVPRCDRYCLGCCHHLGRLIFKEIRHD